MSILAPALGSRPESRFLPRSRDTLHSQLPLLCRRRQAFSVHFNVIFFCSKNQCIAHQMLYRLKIILKYNVRISKNFLRQGFTM